jgi:ATP-binding cassette subfamily C protein CydC
VTAALVDPIRWALARLAPRAGWLLAGGAIALVVFLLNAGLMAAAGASAGGLLLAWWLRGLAVARVATRYAERLISHHALFLALAELRVWVFRRLAARAPLGPGFERASDWLARITHDVEALDGLYLRALLPFGLALAAGLCAAAALRAATPLGALAALLLTLAAVAVAVGFAARAAAAGTTLATAAGSLRANAADALGGLRTLAANGALPATATRLAADDAALIAAQRRVAMLAGRASAAGVILAQGALLAALGLAALAWQSGAASPLVAAALLVLIAALEPIGMLPRAGEALAVAAAAATRLRQAADAPAAVAEPAQPAAPPGDGSLSLRNLTFAWGPRGAVLRGLDLDVPDGAAVAIVAESGAGKSSLLTALLKLAPVGAGEVRIGGADLAALDGGQARAAIAALPQGAHLFADTIRANLLLARPDADDAALWQALEHAQLAAFVRGLPQGLETFVGEGGAALSGGQARRLALARALLQPGRVLLLDEPCAGLDGPTERAVLAALEDARAGRTMVLLLHRLTGAERLDSLWRLVDGRLVAEPQPANRAKSRASTA